jgi:hypothetical protein
MLDFVLFAGGLYLDSFGIDALAALCFCHFLYSSFWRVWSFQKHYSRSTRSISAQ